MSSREWKDENKYILYRCIRPLKYATFPLKNHFFIFNKNPRWSIFYLFFSYSKADICTLLYYFSVKEAKAQILDFLTYIIYDMFYFFK
jgi:hypothetical protein